MQGIVDCFRHTIFSFAESGTHDCYSTIFQDGFHIGKVKIDCTPHGNNLGKCLGCDGKSIIGFAEGVHKSKVGVYFAQAFVVDNQQGINMLGDTLYAVQCLDNFLFSFEDKGMVTIPTVRISISFAMRAMTGAAPVPVPPPIPAVMNTILVPSFSWFLISSILSSAASRARSGTVTSSQTLP